jgi:N-methylhydantoinase A
MHSSGGIISAEIAAEEPVRTVLSGPAGGAIGAHHLGRLAGFDQFIGFDMGGTSTDVSTIEAPTRLMTCSTWERPHGSALVADNVLRFG